MRNTYPGGKGSSGTYQRIINTMPPHTTYIEPFLGGGSILKNKRAADTNIGIDIDLQVIAQWSENKRTTDTIILSDGIQILKDYQWSGGELVYCDPPYVMQSRTGGAYYQHEFTDTQHLELLEVIKTLPCHVMISGYHSKLYTKHLKSWHLSTFGSMTRRGMALEHLWCNFPPPNELHDYQYLGDDYRERERIKRKIQRFTNKLQELPPLERQAIISAVSEI